MKSYAIYNCPSLKKKNLKYGYALNSLLGNKDLWHIENPSKVAEVYETTNVKLNGYGVGKDIALRHLNGANYAFVDGHVKWLKTDRILQFTFNPQ